MNSTSIEKCALPTFDQTHLAKSKIQKTYQNEHPTFQTDHTFGSLFDEFYIGGTPFNIFTLSRTIFYHYSDHYLKQGKLIEGEGLVQLTSLSSLV
jgi:hypothetical protein